jgi:F1F0 ATPase subunit 2
MTGLALLTLALASGLLLGAFVFVGLWWTLRRGLAAPNPALWFGLSALVRLAVVIVGFYYLTLTGWPSVVMGLLGLLMARFAVTRLLRVAH